MTQTLTPDAPQATPPKTRVLTAVGLLVLVASAVVGSDVYGIRERLWGSEAPPPRAPAAGREATEPPPLSGTTPPPQRTTLRSQPWWQKVATLQGTGSTTAAPFSIDGGAIQWRVTTTCESGRLSVQVADRVRPVVEAQCPASETGYSTRTGAVALQVRADGPWQVQVEQQIDLPLNEPPLPGMTAPGARKLATGEFYRVDQTGNGRLDIYRLPDGTQALRLENFYVTPNVDLEIALSPLSAPRTTQEIADAGFTIVARLDVTAGSMNFVIPATVNLTQFRSVVIWCQPAFSAYSAAVLQTGQ